MKTKKIQKLKQEVESKLGQKVTYDDFLSGFDLAFNRYEQEIQKSI